ncbi:hypothetical protein LKO27_06335 [Tessaracoccus sp. OS52]|uniref:hypothetical protein n=1 Tax=Tessaracoccus sp. OS52 TaxID=2886691 RepID=UPI001D117DAE|nr:hypothetical protein [Tessaracoccus sp. OS52]MCC2593030.1 hypothetical protein [Tessaracoccus sp. OS52]
MSEAVVRDSRGENLSLLLGAIGLLVGAGVGRAVLDPPSPLFGQGSVGELAAWTAFFTAGGSFVVAMVRILPLVRPWLRRLPLWRKLLDVAGLALVHGAFSFLGTAALFSVFAEAFSGLETDRWAGAFLVSLACGVCAYASAGNATSMTTESLSVLVAVFLVVGATASALYASDESWWQHHFSALGAAADASGVVFNFTLILTGVVLTTVADFLTHDLSVWAEREGERRWKVTFVRLSLIALGALLAGVGLVPVSLSLFWHNLVTYALIGVFVLALLGAPLLFRRLPGGFWVVTVVVVVLIAAAVFLHLGIGYLNITAFELAAVGVVFGWLLLFIRTVAAAAATQPVEPAFLPGGGSP